MTMRTIILKVHLYLGLFAATFLVILGVTGSIIAFEEDTELWLHHQLHYVSPAGKELSEGEIIEKVSRAVAPAEVVFAQGFQQPDRTHILLTIERKSSDSQMESGGNWRNWVARGGGRAAVFVNPYDASIVGRYTDVPQNQKILAKIHQFHMRLAPDPRSWAPFSNFTRQIVDYSGLALCLLVPTGVILWWRTKRARIRWDTTWFRTCFDIHHAVGIYAAFFLFVAAVTSVVISFESVNHAIYSVTGSAHAWHSGGPGSAPSHGAAPTTVDKAIEIARDQIPEAAFDGIALPRTPGQSFVVLMRVPEEVTPAVHSSVVIDQFSGKPLQVLNFKKDDLAYRIMRLNRAIHTGDVFGVPSRFVASASSLLLVVMTITGLVIWWKKLAV